MSADIEWTDDEGRFAEILLDLLRQHSFLTGSPLDYEDTAGALARLLQPTHVLGPVWSVKVPQELR